MPRTMQATQDSTVQSFASRVYLNIWLDGKTPFEKMNDKELSEFVMEMRKSIPLMHMDPRNQRYVSRWIFDSPSEHKRGKSLVYVFEAWGGDIPTYRRNLTFDRMFTHLKDFQQKCLNNQ